MIIYSVERIALERQQSGTFHGRRISMDSLSFRFGAFVRSIQIDLFYAFVAIIIAGNELWFSFTVESDINTTFCHL